MKRSLRNSRIQENGEKNTEEVNGEQLSKIKEMAKKYEGKSENDIFNELAKTVEKGKKEGSITNDKINSIASTIAPMLNAQQKNKLNELMKKLK